MYLLPPHHVHLVVMVVVLVLPLHHARLAHVVVAGAHLLHHDHAHDLGRIKEHIHPDFLLQRTFV